MIDKIKKWFTSIFFKHKYHRNTYAVTTGAYAGEVFIFIKQEGDIMHFLSIPENINRSIPVAKFDFGIQHSILDFVERIPSKIYKTTIKQFQKNESTNRRE